MRGTLHMVRSVDFGWLLALLGPVNIRSDARRRAQLGLTEDVCDHALSVLPQVLNEPLTRAQLIGRLVGAGVQVTPTGQAPAHLLMYAACAGVICRGPEGAKDEPSYVLTTQWLPDHRPDQRFERDTSLRLLAERYLAGYGPASLDDFTAWSGLSKTDARAAIGFLGAEAVRLDTELGDLFALEAALHEQHASKTSTQEHSVKLLGAFDTLLLGYRARDFTLDPAHAKKVQAGGGMISPIAVCDGEVVGTWRIDRSSRGAVITLRPFTPLPSSRRGSWEAEAAAVGAFYGHEATLKIE